jgi:hypothetical protein
VTLSERNSDGQAGSNRQLKRPSSAMACVSALPRGLACRTIRSTGQLGAIAAPSKARAGFARPSLGFRALNASWEFMLHG